MEFNGREIKELTEDVVFKPLRPKSAGPVKCQPCEDITGKLFTGQGKDGYFESLSDANKHEMAFVIDRTTSYRIDSGKILRASSLVDRENWRWIQLHPYLVMTKEKGLSSRDAVYYVENRQAEAAARVNTSKNRDKARYMIQFVLPLEQQIEVARAIGHPGPKSMTAIELQDYLLIQAEVNEVAVAIIKAADPKNAEETAVRITFNELLRWRIVEKRQGGVYYFQGIFVGRNEQQVQSWLQDPEHIETVAAMQAMLEEKLKMGETVPV